MIRLDDKEKARAFALYKQGKSIREIASTMGKNRASLNDWFSNMVRSGELERREKYNFQKGEAQARKKRAQELLLEGKTRAEVCEIMDISNGTLSSYYMELLRAGKIEPQESSVAVKPKAHTQATVSLKPGETIKCCARVSRTCVYGNNSVAAGLCRFSLVTGKCRSVTETNEAGEIVFQGCGTNNCIYYSRISKTNPRLITPDD